MCAYPPLGKLLDQTSHFHPLISYTEAEVDPINLEREPCQQRPPVTPVSPSGPHAEDESVYLRAHLSTTSVTPIRHVTAQHTAGTGRVSFLSPSRGRVPRTSLSRLNWAGPKEVSSAPSPAESGGVGLPISRLPDEGHLTRGDLSSEDFGFKSDPTQEVRVKVWERRQ